jgi:hypothetical protein
LHDRFPEAIKGVFEVGLCLLGSVFLLVRKVRRIKARK